MNEMIVQTAPAGCSVEVLIGVNMKFTMSMHEIRKSIREAAIFAAPFVIAAWSVTCLLYKDPPELPYVTLVGMVSFPGGCIGLVIAIILFFKNLKRAK